MKGNVLVSLNLRSLLVLDALTCVLMGAALCFAAELLASLLNISANFIFWAGIILIPCALLMAVAAIPSTPPVALAWFVVIGNVGWVLASLVSAFVILDPNTLGIGFIVVQAIVVSIVAALEFRALPRESKPEFA